MEFEHRNEKVLPFRSFLKRMLRFTFFALFLIFFSVGLGTIGYHILAHLGWIDSFHMSCMILTGMGPVIEMKTNTAKLFSSFFALYSGVAFLSIIAVFFAPVVHRLLHKLHVDDTDDNDVSKE